MAKKYDNEEAISQRKQHLEFKLPPEYIVISRKQGEDKSNVFIAEHKQTTGLRSYIPSFIKNSLWGTPIAAPVHD